MDGTTIIQRPADPLPDVLRFVDDLQSLRGYRARVLKHSLAFSRLYRKKLTTMQMVLALGSGLLISAQPLSTSLTGLGWIKNRPKSRTYISTTEPLDHMYTPAFRVESRFESYFDPTMVTDQNGQLHRDMLESGLLESIATGKVAARA